MKKNRGRNTALALMFAGLLGATTACGGNDSDGSSDNSGGKVSTGKNCVDSDNHNVCDAMTKSVVVVDGTANGKIVELFNNAGGGDPVNTFMGEGNLVTSGTPLKIVCHAPSPGSGSGTFGVLLTTGFKSETADVKRFATGKIQDRNWASVAFINAAGVDNADAVRGQLKTELEKNYKDLKSDSCEDNRVVTTELGKSLVTKK